MIEKVLIRVKNTVRTFPVNRASGTHFLKIEQRTFHWKIILPNLYNVFSGDILIYFFI